MPKRILKRLLFTGGAITATVLVYGWWKFHQLRKEMLVFLPFDRDYQP